MVGDQQPVGGWKQKIQVWLPLLLASVLVAGMLVGMRLQSAAPAVMVQPIESSENAGSQGRIEELIRYIEAKYVDDVDRERLIRKAIESMLGELDPHSNYIPAEEIKEVTEQLEGNFDGIGVEFMMLEDTIVVVTPLAGGPAASAGVMAGDKIVMIGDSAVAGNKRSNRDITNLLRGAGGTQVTIGVKRNGVKELLKFTITRDKIPMNSVDVSYMLNDKIGYIKINRFSANTYDEFVQALEKLVETRGMEDLVLDLRHNPGGYLQQASNMLSQLFNEKDKLLVYTEGRSVARTEYKTTGRSFYDIKDVVVLIDEGSASASEIMAGAIQDHDRGVIIGRRSFGKGLVQEQYPLRDGSALRLTVARYYTPSGRSIQKPYENAASYEQELDERFASGELAEGEKAPVLDTTRFYTAGGHVVYGGGGIIPDIIVPLDTNLYSSVASELRQFLPNFVFRHIEEHPELKRRYNSQRFAEQYRVDEAMLGRFIAYARNRGFKKAESTIDARLRNRLSLEIKATLGRQLFNDEVYYTILNKEDDIVRRALNVLGQPNPLAAARQ